MRACALHIALAFLFGASLVAIVARRALRAHHDDIKRLRSLLPPA